MKYIGLNWTLALKFSIGKKKRMCDCRILMAHDCIYIYFEAQARDFENIFEVLIIISLYLNPYNTSYPNLYPKSYPSTYDIPKPVPKP